MGYAIPKSHGWKQRPNPGGGGGGASTPYAEWVDLDLTTSKWAVVGSNGSLGAVPNNWAATNSGDKLIITAGVEDVKGDATNITKYNPSAGAAVIGGFGLIYKDHIDCTPAGAPTGVTADTFYSEYAIINVRLQFGQLGAATSGCGYGIGTNNATDTDPFGTGGKGSYTRCMVGWAFYDSSQGGNPTAVSTCDRLHRYAQAVRVDKHDAQADGDCNVAFTTIAPNDGATPALHDNSVQAYENTDFNFQQNAQIHLRESVADTDGFDQVHMQIGGYPTVSDANAGANNDSQHEGLIMCWLASTADDDLDSLPLHATGPLLDYNFHNTEQMRYVGAYAHPMVIVDQRSNAGYGTGERAQVVIEKVSVLVQPIAGRRSF